MNKQGSLRKLGSYLRPYWFLFALSFILILIISGLELLNPYVIKLAIDDHISIQDRLVYCVESSSEETIEINGENYLLDVSYKDQDQYNIIATSRIKRDGDDFYLDQGKDLYKLSESEYKEIRSQDIKGINNISIIFLFIIVFTYIFSYIQNLLLNYTGQKIIYNIRNDLYRHIQSLSLSFFDRNAIGRLVTRVNNDTESLNELFTNVLVQLLQDVITLIGIVIIMFALDRKLAIFAFSFLPILAIIALVFKDKLGKIYVKVRKNLSKLNSNLNEYISGMSTIQIFNKEEKMSRTFDNTNKNYLDSSLKQVTIHASLRPVVEIAMGLAIASIIYLGGNQVLRRTLEIGSLYVFIDYIQRFFRPIFDLTEKLNIIQSAMTSADRIFEILEVDDKIENPTEPIDIDSFEGKIEFKNVWFAYEDDDWVLKDLSFTIEPGQAIAFVGSTGAGKSTIISLITRLYDIQKGSILIDGIDIRDMDKYELRRKIGVVQQSVFLFSGTIADNIRLYSDEISDRDILEVARYVNADRFIEKLPQGYEQEVSERGSTFSAGQRQLLSFARTLAFKPDILILDEATSNIDTQTELIIQDTMEKVIKGRTSIVIAHRLSTVRNMDKIYVLENGRIVEEGSHYDLLKNNDIYYKLYKLQVD